jgi:hypothetical protein
MTALVFTEARHPFDGLIEAVHHLSIDEVIVAQNQTIQVGTVLGSIGVTGNETLVGAVGAGNIGTCTIGSITATPSAINGVYNITLLQTSSTAEFEVGRPDGTIDGMGKIGTAYSGSIGFTITNGGTATIGDSFTVTVTRPFNEAGEQFEAWAPGAADGSQAAVSIALFPAVTSAGQTQKIAALRREGAFRASAVNFAVASFTGSISATTLTVTSMLSGQIGLGTTLSGAGVTAGTTITAAGTGVGGVGTYTVSASQTVPSAALSSAPSAQQIAYATQQLAAKGIILR